MKNYPLLPLNHQKQWISWNKTYLTEINHNIESLQDYINYFQPDYCRQMLEISGSGSDTIDATQLDYNEYYRAITPVKVMLGSAATNISLGAGYLLVSKARNEGSKSYSQDLNYYFVQPFGYGSFYIISYDSTGQLIGTYDKYAEESYGLNYMFSLFNHWPRFLLVNGYGKNQRPLGKTWSLVSYVSADTQSSNRICTYNKTLWTDISKPPMVFYFNIPTADQEDDSASPSYGEEYIVDSIYYTSVNIDKTNVAHYTKEVLEKGNNYIWPKDIVVRVI